MAFLFSLGFAFAASPVIKVLDPNGGEAIASESVYGIDFNLSDADADELLASIYYTEYSEGTGSYQYAIVKDWNVTNTQYCPNYSVSSTEYTCTYNWDTNKYYTDVSDVNLVVFYPMDYNMMSDSNFVRDWSHNDWNALNTGTDANIADFNTSDCFDGNCYYFQRAGKDKMRTDVIDISFEEGTLSGWFKPEVWGSGNDSIIGWHATNGAVEWIALNRYEANVYGQLYDDTGTLKCNITYNVSAFSGWHHLAFTWKNNGVCYLYVDGVQRNTASVSGADMSYDVGHRIQIGDDGVFSPNYTFQGSADEVKVYSRQLSGAEIMLDYNRLKVADNRYYLDANVMDGWTGTETTDSSDGEFAIGSGTVVIKVPKDEKTLANISTFDVRVIGTLSQDFNGLTADKNVVISIGENYRIIVDSNEEGYYQRNYYIHLTEGDESITIQPYLVDQNNGLLVWIYLIDPNTTQRIPDILIRVYKSISGYGTVEVESILTDASGSANLAFIALDSYTLYYYDGNTLLKTDILNPSSTTYYSYIDTGTITIPDINVSQISVVFTPQRYLYPPSADANVSIDVNISISTNDGTAIWIYARQLDRTIYSLYDVNLLNVASGKNYSFDLNQSDLNNWIAVSVEAIIQTSLQTQSFSKSFKVMKTGQHHMDLNAMAAGFINDVGYFGGILVALFTYLAIAMASVRFVGLEASGAIALGAVVFGFFTFIGFIPLWIEAIIIALAIASWMVMRS